MRNMSAKKIAICAAYAHFCSAQMAALRTALAKACTFAVRWRSTWVTAQIVSAHSGRGGKTVFNPNSAAELAG